MSDVPTQTQKFLPCTRKGVCQKLNISTSATGLPTNLINKQHLPARSVNIRSTNNNSTHRRLRRLTYYTATANCYANFSAISSSKRRIPQSLFIIFVKKKIASNVVWRLQFFSFCVLLIYFGVADNNTVQSVDLGSCYEIIFTVSKYANVFDI